MNNSQEWSARTFGNEDLLPQVPVPTLEDSARRFIEWCAPLLTEQELVQTESAVAEFLAPGSVAHRLQSELEQFDSSAGTRSWLDRFWPSRYLGRRDRIALNANFYFLFGRAEYGQAERAARLIGSAVDYKLLLDKEELPPIIIKNIPQTMAQNKYLFSTTRIPGAEQDTVRAPYSAAEPGPSTARHIVVFFRGTMFSMDVLDADGVPYAQQDLLSGLREILSNSWNAPDNSVGHLTTKARAEWAASRKKLIELGNTASLDTVETALFVVCLEDFAPQDDQQACDQLLYGNRGNRWFDKAVSLIVFADGTAGINIEHCELDGTTILSFVDTILGNAPRERAAIGTPAVRTVDFTLDEEIRADIRSADEAFAAYADATATTVRTLHGYGSSKAKQLGMSPDAFVQMAYQLAHRRTKGITGATYESIATRQYQNGRTEAMRVVTPEVVRFVETMDDAQASAESKIAAFRAAAEKHVARAKECQQGKAPEQHLWELQLINKREGGAELALYQSPGWTIMRNDYLSTSSAPSVNIDYFGFGATSTQCIGVAYAMLPDSLNVTLSTPRPVSAEMFRFADEVTAAIHELSDLLS